MRLKVLTFNIHKGLNTASNKLVLHKIRDLLYELDADIIFLQEVQGEHAKRQNKFIDWPELPQTEFLAQDKWPYHIYAENHSHEYGHHGNAILSKYPLYASKNIDISSHRFSNRGLLYSRLQHPDFKHNIHLVCTHFGLFKKERRKQFESLNKFVEETAIDDKPLLIAGDFNDWRSKSLRLLSDSLNLQEVFHTLKGFHAKSFPAKFPLLKVDRIYYRGLSAQSCKTIKTQKISDHVPLIAEFTEDEAIQN